MTMPTPQQAADLTKLVFDTAEEERQAMKLPELNIDIKFSPNPEFIRIMLSVFQDQLCIATELMTRRTGGAWAGYGLRQEVDLAVCHMCGKLNRSLLSRKTP